MKNKKPCPVCRDTKEVAYIAMPVGKRIYRCPRCAGGEVPKQVQAIIKSTSKTH